MLFLSLIPNSRRKNTKFCTISKLRIILYYLWEDVVALIRTRYIFTIWCASLTLHSPRCLLLITPFSVDYSHRLCPYNCLTTSLCQISLSLLSCCYIFLPLFLFYLFTTFHEIGLTRAATVHCQYLTVSVAWFAILFLRRDNSLYEWIVFRIFFLLYYTLPMFCFV